MASPIVLLNGASTATAGSVAPGSTFTVKLQDTSGVASWEITCFSTSENTDTATINATYVLTDNANKIATFDAPNDEGVALLFRSTINNGVDANGRPRPDWTTTFKVYVPASNGLEVIALNETSESGPYGWLSPFNTLVRSGSSGGSSSSYPSDYASLTGSYFTGPVTASLGLSSSLVSADRVKVTVADGGSARTAVSSQNNINLTFGDTLGGQPGGAYQSFFHGYGYAYLGNVDFGNFFLANTLAIPPELSGYASSVKLFEANSTRWTSLVPVTASLGLSASHVSFGPSPSSTGYIRTSGGSLINWWNGVSNRSVIAANNGTQEVEFGAAASGYTKLQGYSLTFDSYAGSTFSSTPTGAATTFNTPVTASLGLSASFINLGGSGNAWPDAGAIRLPYNNGDYNPIIVAKYYDNVTDVNFLAYNGTSWNLGTTGTNLFAYMYTFLISANGGVGASYYNGWSQYNNDRGAYDVQYTTTGATFSTPVSASAGLSGSLQRIGPNLPYLVGAGSITVSTSSNGQVVITGTGGSSGGGDPDAQYLVLASTSSLSNERVFTAGTGLLGTTPAGNYTLAIDNNVVATVSGTAFTGAVKFGSQTAGTDAFVFASGSSGVLSGSNRKVVVLPDLVLSGNHQLQIVSGTKVKKWSLDGVTVTTNATPTQVHQWTLASGSTSVDVSVDAVNANVSQAGSFRRSTLFRNQAGSGAQDTVVGGIDAGTLITSGSTWGTSIDRSGTIARLYVTGSTSNTVTWSWTINAKETTP